MKRALVTGATGQDGRYLCEFLLTQGYAVHGMARPSTAERELAPQVTWHEADITDGCRIRDLVSEVAPHEIYNLAAQSHVGKSFQQPGLTFAVNAAGTLNVLEAARAVGCKFYQASTSELFGDIAPPHNEHSGFSPQSPYAVAKLAAHYAAANYRQAYGLFVCNGILFNHESPRRGPEFVTRKITRAVAEFACGRVAPLMLGNLDAKRDWGHAFDYVRGMWMMLQQSDPDDYVLATGETHSVRHLVDTAFDCIGWSIRWKNAHGGLAARGYHDDRVVVAVSQENRRPAEVPALCGDARKARDVLGWAPTFTFKALVADMVAADLKETQCRRVTISSAA